MQGQIAALWTVQNGFLDDVEVEKVGDFLSQLGDFMVTRKADLLARIAKEKALNDDLNAALKAAVSAFKQTHS
jgi:F-type H+-transporting ATPase subunit alpha